MKRIHKFSTLPFEVKDLDEKAGKFSGYASAFGNTDSEGDIIAKGAFKQTIKKNNAKWPILWQHNMREPIGVNVEAEEDEFGLKVTGQLALDMPQAQAAYAWMKMALAAGLKVGLSIGFRILDQVRDGSKRVIKEIALVEYSIVTFPANELAEVIGVKSVSDIQKAMDFNDAFQQELNERKLRELGWTIENARYDALRSVESDEDMSVAKKIELIGEIFKQYGETMTAWYVKYFELMTPKDDDEDEDKAGAKISSKNRRLLETAMDLSDQACRMHREASRLNFRSLSIINAVTAGVPTEKDSDDDLDLPSIQPPSDPATKAINPALKAAIDSLHKSMVGQKVA